MLEHLIYAKILLENFYKCALLNSVADNSSCKVIKNHFVL